MTARGCAVPMWALVTSIAISVALGLCLQWIETGESGGDPLVTFASPLGIVSFEFPDDEAEAQAIMKAWGEEVIERHVKPSLNIDYLFAISYSVSFILCWLRFFNNHPLPASSGWRWWRDRLLFAGPPILLAVACICDCIENYLLLQMLEAPGEITQRATNGVYQAAYIKFTIVLFVGVPGVVLAVTSDEFLRWLYDRTLRPWAEWIARYPLLAAAGGLILYLTGIPDTENPGLGVQYLFWHDNPEVRRVAGAMLGAVILQLSFVGYLLDSEQQPWLSSIPATETNSYRRFFKGLRARVDYLLATSVPLLVVIVYRAYFLYPARSDLAFVMAASVFIYWVAWEALALASLTWDITPDLGFVRTLRSTPWGQYIFRAPQDPDLARFHRSASILFTGMVLVFIVMLFQEPQAAVAICTLIGVVTAIYGRLVYMFPQRYFGWFALFVVVFIVTSGLRVYPHRFDGLEFYYHVAHTQHLDKYETTAADVERVQNQLLLNRWRAKHDGRSDKPKLIVVSVSGGGIRAAVWTTIVLTHLEEKIERFPSHVRIVTGTSGGMLGASYYVATLPKDGDARDEKELDQLVKRSSLESLSVAARGVAFDAALAVPSAVYPLARIDRGQAIERQWEKNTNGVLGQTLSSLREGEMEGWRPTLVYTPMLVEDGRRLLISNLDLSHLVDSSGSLLDSELHPRATYSRSGIQFFDLFLRARGKLRLSTAVRMNASFPYITPAGVLPTHPPRRVADAGYYDNYGVNVASMWLHDLARTSPEWLVNNTSGVILIQINDHPTEYWRSHLRGSGEDVRSPGARGQDWLMTPFHAVMSAREATMLFRNDEQLQHLDHLLNDPDGVMSQLRAAQGDETKAPFFTTVRFEYTGHASLSWYLPKGEIAKLRFCMQGDEFLVDEFKTEPQRELDALKVGFRRNSERLKQLQVLVEVKK